MVEENVGPAVSPENIWKERSQQPISHQLTCAGAPRPKVDSIWDSRLVGWGRNGGHIN